MHPASPALASQPGDAPPALAKIAEPPFSPSQESGAALQAFRGSDGESMFGVPNHSFELGEAAREILERTKRRAESAFDELESPSLFDDF